MNINKYINKTEEFISDSVINNMSKNTILAYQTDLEGLLLFCEKNKIKEIDSSVVRNYFRHLKEKGLTSSTLKRKSSALKAVLKDEFPSSIKIRAEKHHPTILTDEEIKKIQDTIDNNIDWYIFNVMLTTGLRLSEFMSLDKNKLKKQKFTITGKGNKDRVVHLCENLYNKIKEMKDLDRASNLSKSQVRYRLKKLCERAGIEKNVTPHTLRHVFATKSLRDGLDIYRIKKLLGHSSISTTEKYLQMTDVELEEEVRAKSKWNEVITNGRS